MATDLIQRAAAICGYPFTPNSDQLAAWLEGMVCDVTMDQRCMPEGGWSWRFAARRGMDTIATPRFTTIRGCLAAAVVEVDRIEREART
jgi:hypothetical protein